MVSVLHAGTMKILTVVAQKGGAGKSTIAAHLAVAAARAGRAVVALDLDPQKSLADWGASRPHEAPTVVAASPAELPALLEQAKAGGADLVVIDTAPHAASPAAAAVRAADLVLIPTRAAVYDLRAIGTTARLVRAEGKVAWAIINALPPRGEALRVEAEAALQELGLKAAPVVLAQRQDYARALTSGLAVQEAAPSGKAAGEIGALWKWIAKEIKR